MKKLVLLTALVFGLVFSSCSSDDDNGAKDEVNLVGDWQLTHVDFTVMEEEGIPASDACIVELISGYEFYDDSRFYFILGENDAPINFNGDYWTWEGDSDDFKIVQTNSARPPYNFSLTPTKLEVKKNNGKMTMTFHSKMGNGSEADFTLEKVGEIDKNKFPALTDPDGSDYHCGFFDED